MRNINRTNVNIADGIKQAKKGLRKDKREFLEKNETTLKNAFADYDKKAIGNNLHTLSPLWKDKNDCSTAHDLYGSSRPIINKHWENLKSINCGGGTLICPICGLSEAKEMDHYIPREIMPEYSVHLSNLIPLCHDCNHKKSSLWLDERKNRIFFNAYFDTYIPYPLITCDISISSIDRRPQATIKISSSLDASIQAHAIIISTIEKLELMDKFQKEADVFFRKEIVRISEEYNLCKKSKKDFWDDRKAFYTGCLSSVSSWNFIERAVFEELVASHHFEDWVLNHM